MTPSQRILAITGMHRSGTSLAASWLERCGMDLGDEYFEATYGNPRGHFEDLVFVGFHKQVLGRQGINFVIEPERELNVSAQETREAYSLLRERGGRPQWGWKDPRTSLFLDFWRARLLQLRVLGLYRPYNAVVHSLMRRDLRQPAVGLKKALLPYWHHPANRLLANRYLGTWIRHNQALLRHAEQYPDEIVLLRAEDLESKDAAMLHFLAQKWGFHLTPVPIQSVMAEGELHKDLPDIRFSKKLRAQADEVWLALERYRFHGSSSQASSSGTETPSGSGLSGTPLGNLSA
jgi:hypothetical protein